MEQTKQRTEYAVLTQETIATYTEILREELRPAMGCTEPIAIAYAASIVRHALGEMPTQVTIGLSGNIIKNVKSVIVPATGGMHGIPSAVVAGLVANCPEKKLQVLFGLEGMEERLKETLHTVSITIREIESSYPFEIDLFATCGEHTAHVHVINRHTQVVLVERDGEDLTESYRQNDCAEAPSGIQRDILNVEDIVAYAEVVPLEDVRELLNTQITMNMAIAKEGLTHDWGACIGKLLYKDGIVSVRDKARAMAAAGSDARMSGCEMPVCILSGSGNQGMTASIPVVIYAEDMGVDEETLYRALIVSDLVTIHQKTGIGCLSAYCGAISAGCGCGAGICFLNGGRFHEISHTLVNSLAILSGTICDGAKASCAAKIAMAVEAGIMGYEMTCMGREFVSGDGIVTKGVENTIRNVARLAREGMKPTDKEIIQIMLGDPK